jgi:sirohydrochlorin ferrochelatase
MLLSALLGSPVDMAFVATGEPRVRKAVDRARRRGRRVVVASYLLADGLFQEVLGACDADIVTRPLGTDPGLALLVGGRFQTPVPHRCAALPARRADARRA